MNTKKTFPKYDNHEEKDNTLNLSDTGATLLNREKQKKQEKKYFLSPDEIEQLKREWKGLHGNKTYLPPLVEEVLKNRNKRRAILCVPRISRSQVYRDMQNMIASCVTSRG